MGVEPRKIKALRCAPGGTRTVFVGGAGTSVFGGRALLPPRKATRSVGGHARSKSASCNAGVAWAVASRRRRVEGSDVPRAPRMPPRPEMLENGVK